ncbi:glycerophosphodiester phosphodiesterase family protein, partial [Streptomyces sp. NPDC058783]
VWTVDEPGAIRKMLNLGVDGIITDYPQTLTQR